MNRLTALLVALCLALPAGAAPCECQSCPKGGCGDACPCVRVEYGPWTWRTDPATGERYEARDVHTYRTVRAAPGVAAAPTFRAGQHSHDCGRCGYRFWHGAGGGEGYPDHRCPRCGAGPWVVVTGQR